MFRSNYPKLILIAAAIIVFSSLAFSQGPPQDARFGQPGQPGQPMERRPNLLEELGLSREQIQSVRKLNQERKPVEQAARKRFQDANKALNMAIYADSVDDAEYRARLTEFQDAQAELARIKFSNELAVRRLLTSAQLVRFRDLRRRFAEVRENIREAPPQGQERPRQPFRRGNQPPVN